MIPVLAAALAASLTVFVALGALTGQFSYNQRRVASRMVTFGQRDGAEAGDDGGSTLILKEDALSGGGLGQLSWATNQARRLERADVPMKVIEYLLAVAAAAALVTVLVTAISGLLPVGLIFGVVTVGLAEYWVRGRARRRLAKFESQLAGALEVMSTSLKSGFGILEGISTVAREVPKPLGSEFKRVVEETRIGGSFENGLRDMMERMESPDLRIAVRALEVHGKVGGNLSEVLDSVASTMRERDELRGHIRALTAQQRLSIIVVSLLPVWAVGFFLVTQPDAISPLWEDPTGRILLGLALVLETVSIFLMRKLVAIDI